MKNKYLIASVASGVVVTAFLFALFGNARQVVLTEKAVASDKTLTLNSATETGVAESYDNGSFIVRTQLNNAVDWQYKYAKASATGLITLGKSESGNPDGTNFYLGNLDPITSVSEVTVNFEASKTLYVYASSDGTNYYRIAIMSESGTVTGATNYLFFRFTNGNQDNSDLTLNSVSFTYACESSDYTDEKTDMTHGTITYGTSENVANEAVVRDTTTFKNGLNSTDSISITAPVQEVVDSSDNMYRYTFGLPLGRSYTGAEIKKSVFTFYYRSADASAYDGRHSTWRLYTYLSTNGVSYIKVDSKGIELPIQNLTNGASGWTKAAVDFSSAKNIDLLPDNNTVSHLVFRPAYINGTVNIDQMRMEVAAPTSNYATAANAVNLNSAISVSDISTIYGDGVKATATANVAEYTRIFSINLGKDYSFANSQSTGVFTFYLNLNDVTHADTIAEARKILGIQLLKTNSDSANRASDEVSDFGSSAVVWASGDDSSNNGWTKYTIPLTKFTAGTSEVFDRICLKINKTARISMTSGSAVTVADFRIFEFVAA